MTTCPKCGYTRTPADQAPDYECPQCGVVYAKYIAHQATQQAKQEADRRAAEERAKREAAKEAARATRQAAKEAKQAQQQEAARIAALNAALSPKPPKAARKPLGCGSAIVVVVMLGWLAMQFSPSTTSTSRSPPPAQTLTPEQRAAAQARHDRQQRESKARQLCEAYIKANAAFPSTVDIAWLLGTATATAPGGIVVVQMDFTAKNALGAELPFRARCQMGANDQLLSAHTERR